MTERVQISSLWAHLHTRPGSIVSKQAHLIGCTIYPFGAVSQTSSECVVCKEISIDGAGRHASVGLKISIERWCGWTHGHTFSYVVVGVPVVGASSSAEICVRVCVEIGY